jgi:hypothetical protein
LLVGGLKVSLIKQLDPQAFLYAQVATKLLHEVVSPLDALKLSH